MERADWIGVFRKATGHAGKIGQWRGIANRNRHDSRPSARKVAKVRCVVVSFNASGRQPYCPNSHN